MSELLKLNNSSTYTLCVNGIHDNNNMLYLKLIKPSDKTVDEITKEFSDPENTSILTTYNEEFTIRIDNGYIYLVGDINVTDCEMSTHTVDEEKTSETIIEISLTKTLKSVDIDNDNAGDITNTTEQEEAE